MRAKLVRVRLLSGGGGSGGGGAARPPGRRRGGPPRPAPATTSSAGSRCGSRTTPASARASEPSRRPSTLSMEDQSALVEFVKYRGFEFDRYGRRRPLAAGALRRAGPLPTARPPVPGGLGGGPRGGPPARQAAAGLHLRPLEPPRPEDGGRGPLPPRLPAPDPPPVRGGEGPLRRGPEPRRGPRGATRCPPW